MQALAKRVAARSGAVAVDTVVTTVVAGERGPRNQQKRKHRRK